jgi:hypothetical protein
MTAASAVVVERDLNLISVDAFERRGEIDLPSKSSFHCRERDVRIDLSVDRIGDRLRDLIKGVGHPHVDRDIRAGNVEMQRAGGCREQ